MQPFGLAAGALANKKPVKRMPDGFFQLLWEVLTGRRLRFRSSLNRDRFDVNVRSVFTGLTEHHVTINQSEQCVVAADTYVFTWVVLGSALTNQDVTCFCQLATE